MSTRPSLGAPALDRSQPPATATARRFRFPAFERRQLPSGLTLYLAPVRTAPLVLVQYVGDGGARWERPDQAGLMTFAAGLLDEGTQQHSSEELALEIEGLGAFSSAGADWDSATVTLGGLSRHFDRLRELCAEIVLEPAFAPAEIERARRQRLAEIERQRANAGSAAYLALVHELYGEQAYGRPLIGTPESVAGFSRELCASAWRRALSSERAHLLVVGDFEPERASERLAGAFDDPVRGLVRGDSEAPAGPPVAAPRASDHRVVIADRPAAAQSELRIGAHGIARNHPQRAALILLNTVFGGKFTSRINLNLRERHGFTYGAHSRFLEHRDGGPFVISAAVDNAAAGPAVREVFLELERLAQEPISKTELDDARCYLHGVFPYTLQTLQGLLARLEQLAVYDLPDHYFETFFEQLDACTAEELQVLAQRYLAPGAMRVAVAGPAASLLPALSDLGPLRVEEPR